MSRVFCLALAALLSSAIPAAAQDNPDPGMLPVPLYTSQNAPWGVDPLRQFTADVNARLIYGAQNRKLISDMVAALTARAAGLKGRATAIESKPDLAPRVVALKA